MIIALIVSIYSSLRVFTNFKRLQTTGAPTVFFSIFTTEWVAMYMHGRMSMKKVICL